jgi:hypothetical protein
VRSQPTWHDGGRLAARTFIRDHFDHIGRRSAAGLAAGSDAELS